MEDYANAKLVAAAPDLARQVIHLTEQLDEMREVLRLWLAYDDLDEADFAGTGPMLSYANAINKTRAILAKGDKA